MEKVIGFANFNPPAIIYLVISDVHAENLIKERIVTFYLSLLVPGKTQTGALQIFDR